VTSSRDRLLTAANGVGAIASAHADEGEHLRRLPAPVVAALRDADLMRMAVPSAYGGPEADPLTIVECIEAVARADGAAGWCCMIASTTSSLAAFLHPDFAAPIYSDPKVVSGGVFAPNGKAVGDGDSWLVDGRWMWGSGTQHCQWIVGGALADDGTQHVMFFAADDIEFHDTWHTHGLRGSGSLDFSVTGARVPRGRTVVPAAGVRYVDTPLAAFPNFTLLAIGVAAVTLGLARRALDEIVALGTDKRPQFSQRTIAQMGTNQTDLAKAEASVRAARSLLLDEIATAWDAVVRGGKVEVADRVKIRLAGAHAAEAAARATDVAYTMAGGSSVFSSNPLQRCWRDVHVATQHIMVAPRLYETMGKHLFGLDIDSTML